MTWDRTEEMALLSTWFMPVCRTTSLILFTMDCGLIPAIVMLPSSSMLVDGGAGVLVRGAGVVVVVAGVGIDIIMGKGPKGAMPGIACMKGGGMPGIKGMGGTPGGNMSGKL